jgi:glucosylceramidase
LIGSLNNWAVTALEWNLANAPDFIPHTDGGCTECKGALTINITSISEQDMITRNVAYYIIAHASKFIPRGSKRIATSMTEVSNLSVVAFQNADSDMYSKILLVENDDTKDVTFNIRIDKKCWVPVSLKAGTIATYTIRDVLL